MATATATESTRASGDQPRADVTFTGGTANDRLTLADIAAAHSSLSYDSDTGRLTQSDSTARFYRIGGTSTTAAKNAFIELGNQVIELHSNTGTDSSSADRGDTTSKFMLDNQCDAIIGTDTGDSDGPLNGNVIVRSENYSWRFYAYVGVFNEAAKIICHSYLVMAGRQNSRWNLVNRNDESQLRLVIANHTADVHTASVSASDVVTRVNADLDVESVELLVFAREITFRTSLVPGGLQSNEIAIPGVTVGSADDQFTLYWNVISGLTPANEYTVTDMRLFKVGSSTQPKLRVDYSDGTEEAAIRLARYWGDRGDAFFQVVCDDGDLVFTTAQDVTFTITDPAGDSVDVYLRVESGSYTVSFATSVPVITTTEYGTTVNETSTSESTVEIRDKVVAAKEAGAQTVREVSAGSTVAVDSEDLTPVRYSCWAFGYQIQHQVALTLEDVGEASVGVQMIVDDNVTSATDGDVPSTASDSDDIYDILHKYAIDNQQDMAGSLDGSLLDVGSRNVTLGDSSATLAVSGTAITIPCDATVTKGTKVTGLTTTGTITIDSDVTVTASLTDTNGKRINIRGLPAAHDAVVGAWPSADSDRSNIVTGSVADDTATNIVLTLQADTEYKMVADAVSYLRSSEVTFNTGVHDDVDVSLRKITDAAGNDLIPAGSALSTDETTRLGLIDYDHSSDEIRFGATSAQNEYTFDEVARAIEVGQSATDALSNPYICIIQTGSFTFESGASRMLKRASGVGSSLVPDLSGFQFTKIGSNDAKDFVDYSAGAIIVNTGAPAVVSVAVDVDDVNVTQDTWDARMLAVPDTTKETYKGSGGSGSLTQATFDARMLAVPSSTKDMFKADVSAIPTDDVNAVVTNATYGLEAIVNNFLDHADFGLEAIQDDYLADSSHGLAALKTLLDAIPTDDVNAVVTNSTYGLSALKTLIDAIPTDDVNAVVTNSTYGLEALKALIDAIDPPSESEIATELLGTDIETGIDLQAFLRIVGAALTGEASVDAQGRVTFTRLDSSRTDRVRITYGTDDGERTTIELL